MERDDALACDGLQRANRMRHMPGSHHPSYVIHLSGKSPGTFWTLHHQALRRPFPLLLAAGLLIPHMPTIPPLNTCPAEGQCHSPRTQSHRSHRAPTVPSCLRTTRAHIPHRYKIHLFTMDLGNSIGQKRICWARRYYDGMVWTDMDVSRPHPVALSV